MKENTMGNTIRKKRYRKKIRSYAMGVLALILITGLAIAAYGTSVKAGDSQGHAVGVSDEPGQCRCYKSIIIEPGDTLWGIASEFKDAHYDSTQEYIDELMEINGLSSDKIHAGRFLTVSYYK